MATYLTCSHGEEKLRSPNARWWWVTQIPLCLSTVWPGKCLLDRC